jgi:hypothetical protein
VIILLLILFVKAVVSILFVVYGNIYLAPDEAQYWLWSQFLDFGYYSKPPMIAWQIGLGTSVFGSTELGVRIGAIVISFFLPLSTFYLAKSSGLKEKRALAAALILALCPISILGSFSATTDLGFVLFWTLIFAHLAYSLKTAEEPSFITVGIIICLGALYKWTMFLIFPVILLGCFYFKILRNKKIALTFLIALLALLPSLYWNLNHEFATFKHVFAQSVNSSKANFFDFFIAQVALFFPIFFVFFVFSFIKLPKQIRPLRFTNAWAFIFFICYFFLSMKQKMQANWIVFAYPLAAVAAASVISKVWLLSGLILSTVLSFFVLFIPILQKHDAPIPYSLNAFKQCMGSGELKESLSMIGYNPATDVLIADRYQTCSISSFYSLDKKRSYFINLLNQRKNQFSFWPQLEKGMNGYFIVIENRSEEEAEEINKKYISKLSSYFEEVFPASFFSLFKADDKTVKWALIFKVKGFLGHFPNESTNY